jgi:hypothetical protein
MFSHLIAALLLFLKSVPHNVLYDHLPSRIPAASKLYVHAAIFTTPSSAFSIFWNAPDSIAAAMAFLTAVCPAITMECPLARSTTSSTSSPAGHSPNDCVLVTVIVLQPEYEFPKDWVSHQFRIAVILRVRSSLSV